MPRAQGTVLLALALWTMSTELPPRPEFGGMSPRGVRYSVQYPLADQGLYIAWDSVGGKAPLWAWAWLGCLVRLYGERLFHIGRCRVPVTATEVIWLFVERVGG